jgi:hypothetical protein
MKQVVRPGYPLDFLTPDEVVTLIPRARQESRVRAPATFQLDATGAGQGDVFEVEAGYEFEARRVVVTLTGNIPSDPNTGNVALNAAGKYVAYLRSGSLIEYGQPAYGGVIQVPGSQTWSREQGPYLRNQEVFQVKVAGLTASGVVNVYLEGILTRPGSRDNDR